MKRVFFYTDSKDLLPNEGHSVYTENLEGEEDLEVEVDSKDEEYLVDEEDEED